MRFVAASDDEGPTFDAAVDELKVKGHEVDVLARGSWPEVARKVAESVSSGKADMGLVMCWTGTGTSMAANKVPGARAALCWDPWIAEGARRWNDANILVMSLKKTTPDDARSIIDAWLSVDAPDEEEREHISDVEYRSE